MYGAICSLYFLEVPPTGDMKVCAIGQEKGDRASTNGSRFDAVHVRRVPPARSTIVRGIEQVRERRKGMELRIQQLSKHFKDKKAVDEVSFTLTAGVWGTFRG